MKGVTNMESMNTEKKNMLCRFSALALVTLVVASPIVLTACNTVEGVGEDVKAVGDGVADTARDAKD